MDIPVYKNIWYIAAFLLALVIILGSFFLVPPGEVTVTGSSADVEFLAKFAYRAFFNPAWLICVWLYRKGEKLNSARHRDILVSLQAIVASAQDNDQETVLTRTLARVLVQSDDIESTITETLQRGVSVRAEGGNPVVE